MVDSLRNQRLGRFIDTPAGGETLRAFVPPPLPPEPPVDMLALLDRLGLAERALGRLDAITMLLPRQELFLYMYVRKEALLSSQIEGTQSTLSDLLRFETEAQAGQAASPPKRTRPPFPRPAIPVPPRPPPRRSRPRACGSRSCACRPRCTARATTASCRS